MDRYILQKSENKPNHWVCTDTEKGIVCVFEHQKFNETQEFTLLEDVKPDASALAKAAGEMGDWLANNHYKKAMP